MIAAGTQTFELASFFPISTENLPSESNPVNFKILSTVRKSQKDSLSWEHLVNQ